MSEEIAIRVDNVSKNFKLPHERAGSVKSIFTNPFSAKNHKTVEVQHALKNVSFEIKKGEFFGIVGRNGSGKSTMLKMLAGIYQPTHGKIHVAGKLVPFIELGVGFNPELSGRENVYLNGALLGFSSQEVDAMYNEIVEFAELEKFMDQKLKNYSSGMQVRLAFSMAVRARADILLIDEVLAVGDADFQRKCFEYFKKLKKDKKTVVFVSHDMGAVREFCDRALLIDSSELISIGTTESITDKYSKLFLDDDEEAEEVQQTFIEETEKRWGNGKIKIEHVAITKSEQEIKIKATARVNSDLGSVICGVHINSQDGTELTAVNNRMIRIQDLKDVKVGQEVEIYWKMGNVFNDGKFFVTLTLTSETGIAYDWYVDAGNFTIKRPERSTTPILPPIELGYKIN
jgi:ABC-2 type transport system ATP-binding protein